MSRVLPGLSVVLTSAQSVHFMLQQVKFLLISVQVFDALQQLWGGNTGGESSQPAHACSWMILSMYATLCIGERLLKGPGYMTAGGGVLVGGNHPDATPYQPSVRRSTQLDMDASRLPCYRTLLII